MIATLSAVTRERLRRFMRIVRMAAVIGAGVGAVYGGAIARAGRSLAARFPADLHTDWCHRRPAHGFIDRRHRDLPAASRFDAMDVAKETADMVLTDDNYVSIVAAVEQGRIIYANIRSSCFSCFRPMWPRSWPSFCPRSFGLPSPLTAIQLLWLNMVTDGAPALALAKEKGDPDVMERPPRPKTEPIIHGPMRLGIVIQTFAQTRRVL